MLSNLMNNIKPSPTIQISSKAKLLISQGIEIVDFSVGEPDLATPAHIIDAVNDACKAGKTKYTNVDGTLELKKAIVEKLQRENGIHYDTQDITVGCGAKQVIFNAIAATINAGDEVIIPMPAWVSYVDMVQMFNGKVIDLKTEIENQFSINFNELRNKITDKTKWIIINSPSNPTGKVYTENEIRQIGRIMLDFPHVNLISDDIYEHMIYGGGRFSNVVQFFPELINRVLVINGVSKSYCMTGFRIGYGAIKNLNLIKAISTIQSQSTSNPCSISQYASQVALNSEKSKVFIADMKNIMSKRGELAYNMLKDIKNLNPFPSTGAFYIFTSIKNLIGKSCNGKVINSDIDFCNILLDEYEVATVPGSAFGAPGHFRISFAMSEEVIKRGVLKIGKMCSVIS